MFLISTRKRNPDKSLGHERMLKGQYAVYEFFKSSDGKDAQEKTLEDIPVDKDMGTIKRRFDSIKIESNESNRRAYREMLFATKGVEEAISGVILFDETIRTAASDGTPFPQLLAKKGIIPGIKVDKGPVDIPGFPGEVVTEGLDGLRGRLKEYKELGGKFAKWRAVIAIGEGIPTYTCLQANAHALGRYASLCQEAGIVPIVEPEVLLDGNHTIERCQEVTEQTLKITFTELFLQRVQLEGMMPGMDGWQATRELRANGETKDIPILAATALFRDTDLKSCIDAGCNGYIVKPFTFQELQGKVRELIPATAASHSL